MLFNQQQCFIYSTASFLSKLRAKKVEKTTSTNEGLPKNFETEIPESDSGTGVIWYFEPHGKLNPGSIYL